MTTTTIYPDSATAPGGEQQGAPRYSGSGADDEQRSFAIVSFVLGIASIVCGWTLIAPIIGLVLGSLALRRGTSDRTLALWGTWMNGVILAFTALGIIVVLSLIGFGVISGLSWIPFAAL